MTPIRSLFAVLFVLGLLGCGPKPHPDTVVDPNADPIAAELTTCDKLMTELSSDTEFAAALRVTFLGEGFLEFDQPWPFEALTEDQLTLQGENELSEGVVTCELDIFIDREPMQEAITDWRREHTLALFDFAIDSKPHTLQAASLILLETVDFAAQSYDDEGQPTETSTLSFSRDWATCREVAGDFIATGRNTPLTFCDTRAEQNDESSYEGQWELSGGESTSTLEAIVVDEHGHPLVADRLHEDSSQMMGDDFDSSSVTSDVVFMGPEGELPLVVLETTTTEYLIGYPCGGEAEAVELSLLSFREGVVSQVFDTKLSSHQLQECTEGEDEEYMNEYGIEPEESFETTERWDYSFDMVETRIVLTLAESTENPEEIGTEVTYDWKDGMFVETSRLAPDVDPELGDEPGMESGEEPAGEGSER